MNAFPTDLPAGGSPGQPPPVPALIIFVRPPEAGKVKTRIAAEAGAETALAVYRKLLAHTLDTVREAAAVKYVFYAGAVPARDIWSEAGFERLPQAEGDLGARMESAVREVLHRGHPAAVIIGSDCPDLTVTHIRDSFAALRQSDLALGPARDGGYYLLALRSVHPFLFRDMAWSTEGVRAETLKRAAAAGLSVQLLPELSDVDHWADVPAAWQQELLG